jgi:hypothetical protein
MHSCGLLAVSTAVGGVPEVLPHGMLYLAEPDPLGIGSIWLRGWDGAARSLRAVLCSCDIWQR